MAFGLRVEGSAGHVQIDGTYSNLGLVATGSVTALPHFQRGIGVEADVYPATSGGGSGSFEAYYLDVAVANPVVAVKPSTSGLVAFMYLEAIGGGLTRFWFFVPLWLEGGAIGSDARYYVFGDTPAGGASGFGLRVFEGSNPVFDANYRYMKIPAAQPSFSEPAFNYSGTPSEVTTETHFTNEYAASGLTTALVETNLAALWYIADINFDSGAITWFLFKPFLQMGGGGMRWTWVFNWLTTNTVFGFGWSFSKFLAVDVTGA